MKTTKTLETSCEGRLPIGSWLINCYVLKDERRLILQKDLASMIEITNLGRKKSLGQKIASVINKPIMKSKRISALINKLERPIRFHSKAGDELDGYEAETLIEYCKSILEVRRLYEQYLNEKELDYADTCESFLVSIAHVGIISLIDEATGHQYVRPKDALQQILDRYLRKEYAQWAKRFPDDFYTEMFRLKGWEWEGMHINRPSCVGRYTKDIVYERLAPGVCMELERLNPSDKQGNRKRKHHQWLTDEIGHPALSEHLHTVLAFMRISNTWQQFKDKMDKAFPKINTQMNFLADLSDQG